MKKRSKPRYVRVLVLMAFLNPPAFAEEVPVVPAVNSQTTDESQALDQVSEELFNLERRWYGLMRIRWHDTQLVSAGLGAMLSKQPQHADCSTGCALRGWNFEVEPGLYGIQGGFGWGKLIGETGRTGRFVHTVHYGWNVRAIVLRTWGDSSLYPQSQTLAGIEASVSIIKLNFSVGLLHSLYSGVGEEWSDDWVITTGAGWGF